MFRSRRRPACVLACVALLGMDADGATVRAKLRAEVQELSSQIELEQSSGREEIAALRRERAQLQQEVRAAQARNRSLVRIAAEADARREREDEFAQAWAQPVKSAIEVARAHVAATLPFARSERVNVLDGLQRELQRASVDYARVLERLLRWVEEEQAVAGEIAYGQLRVEIDGVSQLAAAIRISNALLYIQTADGRVGWAQQDGTTWGYRLFEHPKLVAAVKDRFSAAADNRLVGRGPLVVPTALTEYAQ